MLSTRYLEATVSADLEQKMVFVAGPRQVGKTTLARQVLAKRTAGAYLSWDRREDRDAIRKAQWPAGEALVVLDELHKYRHWKRWIKGEFDAHRDRLSFLVTGSARLDVYRRGGDSLQGRYHHYRLHPFSAAELEWPGRARAPIQPFAEIAPEAVVTPSAIDALMEFGGFPEPLLARSPRNLRRWRTERLDRFLREDVRDLEAVREISPLQTLADLLPVRVASPLSINALREDLEASHRAVGHWMDIFDRLYFTYRIAPYIAKRVRALKKMPKAYLWDWGLVPERGPRFENLVASHLLKFCHLLQDGEGFRTGLHYLRDASGREVDFLVTCDGKPWFAVEAKLADGDPDPALRYFGARIGVKWLYQVALDGRRDFVRDGIRCLPARRFLAALA
jgi:predicted AAA+ superfamily ATPase